MAGMTGGPGRQDWQTPAELFKALDRVVGFDLDVAADDANSLCPRYFTAADDALSQPWKGRVFCNPPYDRIRPWTSKAAAEHQEGRADVVVMLLPASTDARWYHDAIGQGAAAAFIPGRLRFGGAPFTAPFGSMLLCFGVRLVVRKCDNCGGWMASRRSHARTCSERCRKALSRQARSATRTDF